MRELGKTGKADNWLRLQPRVCKELGNNGKTLHPLLEQSIFFNEAGSIGWINCEFEPQNNLLRFVGSGGRLLSKLL